MVSQVIAIDGWQALLKAQDQDISRCPCGTETGLVLHLDPEKIVTVALEQDVLVYPKFRHRYFVCSPEPEHVFGALSCPEPLRLRWLQLVSQQRPSYWRDFLAGPGSWLLSRLARFEDVVIWSDRILDWQGIYDATYRDPGMYFPEAGSSFFSPLRGEPKPFSPCLTAVGQRDFADVVAACFLLVNYGGQDCYVADAEATEVYLVSNDEKVILSIPGVTLRDRIVQELEKSQPPFKNVSGYSGSADDDSEKKDEENKE